MPSEFALFLQGVKGTLDVAKGLKSAYDQHTIVQAQSEIIEKLLALQMDALSLQEKHSALIHEKEELEKKVLEAQKWSETESQYELKQVVPGKIVRSYKKPSESTDPPHWLCPNCWEDKKKSVLQGHLNMGDAWDFSCLRCRFTVGVGRANFPQ
jgi:hypothetical protein